jgi:hypothetical protein
MIASNSAEESTKGEIPALVTTRFPFFKRAGREGKK